MSKRSLSHLLQMAHKIPACCWLSQIPLSLI